ncbi:amidohydrolase [Clostridium sp.]|uniref:amidohydrolase n=1 Tax=Clostridium sp. TaxID=1506 RepID=UPI003F30D357
MLKKIFFNGNIICLDKNNTICNSILIKDGKIHAIDSFDNLKAKNEDAELINLNGNTMIPGFIDPHGHIVAVAQSLLIGNFSGCNSLEDLILELKNIIKEKQPSENEWILGLGYDNSKFPTKAHPTKFDLDKVSSKIPIFITHASGHIAAVNSIALEKLGYVGTDYIVPEGGIVQTIKNSKEPNGVLEEKAFLDDSKKNCIAPPSPQSILECLLKAQNLYASYGITTCQDASIDEGLNQLLLGAAKNNMLKLDVIGYAMQPNTYKIMGDTNTFTAKYTNHYKLLGGKMWLDGSPQGKTAWLTKPYHIAPEGLPSDYCGYSIQSDEVVTSYIKDCIERKYQLNAHCNGDASCDQFIRCYKKAKEELNSNIDLRPVMVHAQTVREDQLDEMKTLGIIPTFFLDHVWYWGDYHYESVLGPERANRISPLNSALKRNMNFTIHQDSPVVMPIMTLAIHNAVNRTTQKGRVLGEEQKISVLDALKSITINGAYQYFEENLKGTIEVGKLADFVILDKNPLEIPSNELKKLVVLETIKEGISIYKK